MRFVETGSTYTCISYYGMNSKVGLASVRCYIVIVVGARETRPNNNNIHGITSITWVGITHTNIMNIGP